MADEKDKDRDERTASRAGYVKTLRRRHDHLDKEIRGLEAIGEQPGSLHWKRGERAALAWVLADLESEHGGVLRFDEALDIVRRRMRAVSDVLALFSEEQQREWIGRLDELARQIDLTVSDILDRSHRKADDRSAS